MTDVEKFRTFVVRRAWLRLDGDLLNEQDYQSLKARDGRFWGSLNESQRQYLLGYADGFKSRSKQ